MTITLERLKLLVTYDPETGHFTANAISKYSNKERGDRVGTLHKSKGYRYLTLDGKTYREHRVAFLYMTGNWPKKQIDHINHDKSDNSWKNLKEASPKENCWNRPMYSNNKSGYTGVIWNKVCSKWMVLCRSSGVQKYLGLYDDVHEAGKIAAAYYAAVR